MSDIDMGDVHRRLNSADTTLRLEAARDAARAATIDDLSRLMEKRHHESDSWVRSILDSAIDRIRRTEPPIDVLINLDGPERADVDRDIRDKAIEYVTKLIVHECRPLVGRLERRAREDVDGFEGSGTAQAISRLREFLRVLEKIHEAVGAPSRIEFDLTDLVFSVATELEVGEKVILSPSEPVTVSGDPEMLRLLLPPLITNAIEASDDGSGAVVISCGRSDIEAWIVVLDEGRGLPPGASNVWEPGFTTKGKTDHLGWGLAVVQTTVRSLGGSVSLLPREPRGAAAEVRWPQTQEA